MQLPSFATLSFGQILIAALTSPATVLLVTAALVVLTTRLLLGAGIRWLVIGEDNRYSNSKFQMAAWFLVLITSYVAALFFRWRGGGWALVGGVDIPLHLAALSGLSAATFVGAKQVVKTNIASAAMRGITTLKAPSRFGPRFPSDLINDDSGHRPDLGDVQMVLVTLLAVSVYLVQVSTWLSAVPLTTSTALPDVDLTILGTFGLGQATYLTKKYIGDAPPPTAPGPVRNIDPPRPD